jgi:hypothetical protein
MKSKEAQMESSTAHENDNRVFEVATILAAGVLRLRSRIAFPDPGEHAEEKNLPKSGQDCLELPTKAVLSGHTG